MHTDMEMNLKAAKRTFTTRAHFNRCTQIYFKHMPVCFSWKLNRIFSSVILSQLNFFFIESLLLVSHSSSFNLPQWVSSQKHLIRGPYGHIRVLLHSAKRSLCIYHTKKKNGVLFELETISNAYQMLKVPNYIRWMNENKYH